MVCNGTAFPDFTIAGRHGSGQLFAKLGPFLRARPCTVTEITDGGTATVTALVSGNGQTVTIPAGEVVPVNVMDVYENGPSPAPDVATGNLKVIKTIGGPAAGQQGRIAILVECHDAAHTYAVNIPADAGAGSEPRWFPDIPAGSRCTITETVERPHQHSGGDYGRSALDGDHTGRSHSDRSCHRHFLRRERGGGHRVTRPDRSWPGRGHGALPAFRDQKGWEAPRVMARAMRVWPPPGSHQAGRS